MAVLSEGLESKADFDEALATAGESILRVRPGYIDNDGNWVEEEIFHQRALFETVRLQSATSQNESGMVNVANSAMKIIYISPTDGNPDEADTIVRQGMRYALTDLDNLVVDDEIVYWFSPMVRSQQVKQSG